MKTDNRQNGFFGWGFPLWNREGDAQAGPWQMASSGWDWMGANPCLFGNTAAAGQEIWKTGLENWYRVVQRGLDLAVASLGEEPPKPEPFFDAVETAAREIPRTLEAAFRKSSISPIGEFVDTAGANWKVFEKEREIAGNQMKKIIAFQVKMGGISRDAMKRCATFAWSVREDGDGWREEARKMIASQVDLVKGVLDDTELPDEIRSKYMAVWEDQARLLEKSLASLDSGSAVVRRSGRAFAESFGEWFRHEGGNGDSSGARGPAPLQERFERSLGRTMEEFHVSETLDRFVADGHELKIAADQLRETLIRWPFVEESSRKSETSASRKSKGGPRKPAAAESVAESE